MSNFSNFSNLYIDNSIQSIQNELLTSFGISTQPVTVTKNAVMKSGLRIDTADINGTVVSPVIYHEEGESMASFMDRVLYAASHPVPYMDLGEILDWEKARDKVFLGIQRVSDEPVVKRRILNVDIILRVYVDVDGRETASVKVNEGLLRHFGVSQATIFNQAITNSEHQYTIHSMSDILDMDDSPESTSLYILSSQRIVEAASGLYFPEIFEAFCKQHDQAAVYILPSSAQELLLVPASRTGGAISEQQMADMVADINVTSCVPEDIQLAPYVYLYTRESKELVIAATAQND